MSKVQRISLAAILAFGEREDLRGLSRTVVYPGEFKTSSKRVQTEFKGCSRTLGTL